VTFRCYQVGANPMALGLPAKCQTK